MAVGNGVAVPSMFNFKTRSEFGMDTVGLFPEMFNSHDPADNSRMDSFWTSGVQTRGVRLVTLPEIPRSEVKNADIGIALILRGKSSAIGGKVRIS